MAESQTPLQKYAAEVLARLLCLIIIAAIGQVWASVLGRFIIGATAFAAITIGSVYILVAKRSSTFAQQVRVHSYSVATRWIAGVVLALSTGLFVVGEALPLLRAATASEPAAAPSQPSDGGLALGPSALPTETHASATATSPLGPCGNCEDTLPPEHACFYRARPNEGAPNISLSLFGTPEHGGRIADIHRDSGGMIAVFQDNQKIVIPSVTMPRTTSYLIFYLAYPICRLDALSFPCLYVSDGENYENLSVMFYKSSRYQDQLARANDTRYDPSIRDIVPLVPSVGDILIIPMVQ